MATELEIYMLDKVNVERQKNNLPPYTMDEELVTAAREHSEWMDRNDTLSHTGEGGSQPDKRIRDTGYDMTGFWGENATQNWLGQSGDLTRAIADEMLTGWMNSTGHRANILNPDFKEIGIGLVKGDHQGTPYGWGTQVFSVPTAAEEGEDDKTTGAATQTPDPQPDPQPNPTPNTSDLQTYMLGLVNESRKAANVPDLKLWGELTTAAQRHTEWMDETDTLTSQGRDGKTLGQRLDDAGYGHGSHWHIFWYVERDDLNQISLKTAFDAWAARDDVRATMTRADTTEAGFGFKDGEYQGKPAVFIEAIFAQPSAQEAATRPAALVAQTVEVGQAGAADYLFA